jgi:hypothetical protein
MPIIPTTWEVEVGGFCFKTGQRKSVRPYLKNKLKAKGLGTELKCRAPA